IEIRVRELRNGQLVIPERNDKDMQNVRPGEQTGNAGGDPTQQRNGRGPRGRMQNREDNAAGLQNDPNRETGTSGSENTQNSEPKEPRGPKNDKFENVPFDQREGQRGTQGDPGFKMNKIDNDAYICAERTVEYNGKKYVIRAFRIYNHELQLINKMCIIFIIENIIAVLVAFFIGRAISSKMLKPVHQVAAAAIKMSEENLSQRIEEPETDDEIKTLVEAFNDMLSRLQISFERQNQFISDVSHELKTPISVIKGYTGLLSRWGKDDPEVLNESIESITAETEHMTMLINRLLFWARNDINSTITISELCIEELLDEIKKEAEVMQLPAQISIEGSESTRIDGDYHLIKQLIWIFVENAVKYSGEKNCVIHFKTELENGRALLRIRDNGIGIKEEDVKNIFERFYRSDKSRNKEIKGFGLGLSIAKWIVDHHNGKIGVESTFGEGTEFLLDFPAKQ
ncbi:MAG: HAMP domain-containing histidine kinase, partial [Firmicutes bacterium]|nr:HAMP domain-containing histidine kinase [Bacillota bacterium]